MLKTEGTNPLNKVFAAHFFNVLMRHKEKLQILATYIRCIYIRIVIVQFAVTFILFFVDVVVAGLSVYT